jgi:3-(3-hydroxy-phenyl)propionate hydroxylase
MQSTQVLIVGAGPVGTVAATRLAQQDIAVTLLEALPGAARDLRGSTFHPPTLEMLEEIGVADAMIAQGLRSPVYQYRERQSPEFFAFDLTELSDITEFPYRLQCEQYKLTRHLSNILAEDPRANLLFSHRVTHFEQDDQGAIVHAQTPESTETFRADYVIAADGANSIVRNLASIAFEGFTYPEKFVTLSTTYALERHFEGLANVNYIADPDAWVLLLRTPTVWRVLVPAAESRSDEYLLSDEFKNDIFAGLTGKPDGIQTEHRTIYPVHQRVARTYRMQRLLLAGDAAHLNNPLGGFGMNSGIHDAWNLAEKLVAILKNDADDALLDLYDRQRRTVTRDFIQTQSIKNKEMMEQSGEAALRQRRTELRRICNDEKLRREFMLDQALFSSLDDAARIS